MGRQEFGRVFLSAGENSVAKKKLGGSSEDFEQRRVGRLFHDWGKAESA